jgi:hypothetical protein
MNDGILVQPTSTVAMPYRLLGSPTVLPMPYGRREEWHPDVASWMQRAKNNGGQFSYRTLLNLQTFCNAIDAAGLRSTMLRLNLFVGDNLQAALTPIYVSGSATGTTLGNATDTNNNFVSADYTEYGSNGGLLGNGSTKYLDTGFSLSVAGIVSSLVANRVLIGVQDAGFSQYFQIGHNGSANAYESYYGGSSGSPAGTTLSVGAVHALLNRSSNTSIQFYNNGSANGSSSTSVSPGNPGRTVWVFARNQGTAAGPIAARFRGYSIGRTVSASAASTFYTTLTAFATNMERT